MIVRDATLADAPAIGRVHVAAWRSAYAGVTGDSFLASLDSAERAAAFTRWLSEGARVLVALEAGVLCGFAWHGAERADAPGRAV